LHYAVGGTPKRKWYSKQCYVTTIDRFIVMSMDSPEFRRWTAELAAADAATAAAEDAAEAAAQQLLIERQTQALARSQRVEYASGVLERRIRFTIDLAHDVGQLATDSGLEQDMKIRRRRWYSGIPDVSGWILEQERTHLRGDEGPARVNGHFLTSDGAIYKYHFVDDGAPLHKDGWRRLRYSVCVGISEEDYTYVRSGAEDDWETRTRQTDVYDYETVSETDPRAQYKHDTADRLADNPNFLERMQALESEPNIYDAMLTRFVGEKLTPHE
jgi:hypothetical protein